MKKLVLIFIIIISVSCQKLKYGNVVEKWHEPYRQYLMFMPISTGKTTMMIPYFIHDNEDWCIRVQGVTAKGKIITRKYYLDKLTYDKMMVGKTVCVDGECDDDTNNIKVRK